MTWFEDYKAKLSGTMDRNLKRDFPQLANDQVRSLRELLFADQVLFDSRVWRTLNHMLKGWTQVQKFLELYWPSRLPRYKRWLEDNVR
jgi:hypothetical protein